MAKFDITEIQESTITVDLAGKIIGLVGTNNVGKSYVSARLFPGQTLWLATEKGYNAQGGLRPYDIEAWGDFRDAVSQLTTRNKKKREKVRSMYKCVVVDVADKLPNLCNAYIISQYNEKKSAKAQTDGTDFTPISEISEIPFGGGYASLNKELDTQINKLALSGYCVVLIFHDEIRKMKDNRGNEYDYIVPKNTFSKAGNALKDIPDFMIYLESQGVDEDGKPILSKGYCTQHKEFFARSRFTQCPEEINPFTADNLKEMVKIACEREAELLGARTVTYEEEAAARNEVKQAKKLSSSELIEMIQPVFVALVKAKYKSVTLSIVEQYLGIDDDGKPRKISEAEETDVDALQCIYDNLVNFAEEKDVEWEDENDD